MAVNVSVDVTKDTATPVLRNVISKLSPKGRKQLNKAVAPTALAAVRRYYREYGAAKRWENPSLPTHGPGRKKTGFAGEIVSSWGQGRVTADTISVVSDSARLRHKITGGTLRPRKTWLTIPLVPEAHGKRARDFAKDLFFYPRKIDSARRRSQGPFYLAQKIGGSTIRFIYVLKREVTQKEWPGAEIPPEEVLEPVATKMLEVLVEEDPG